MARPKKQAISQKVVKAQVEDASDRFRENREPTLSLTPATGESESRNEQSAGPLTRLKERFEKRRLPSQ